MNVTMTPEHKYPGRQADYPWQTIPAGGSILIELRPWDAKPESVRSAAIAWANRRGLQFKTRWEINPDGVRVWNLGPRAAPEAGVTSGKPRGRPPDPLVAQRRALEQLGKDRYREMRESRAAERRAERVAIDARREAKRLAGEEEDRIIAAAEAKHKKWLDDIKAGRGDPTRLNSPANDDPEQ